MILITGASGNVGKEVLKQIAKTGTRVRATFQSIANAANAPSGVEVVTMDYNKPETIRAALKGVDSVFLVGPPTANLPAMERKAVDEIKQAGGIRIVKQSAMGGREATFTRQHAESEDYIKSSEVLLYLFTTERIHAELRQLQRRYYQRSECVLWLSGRWESEPYRYTRHRRGRGSCSHG